MAHAGVMGGVGFGVGQSLGTSLPVASALPRLVQETEIQKLLTDERIRSEQHKTNYQQLKAEHSRLQEEYLSLQEEVKATVEESRIVQEKYRSMYETCRRELVDRQALLDDLRTKVMTPQRLEIVRSQVLEEVERSYQERYLKQEQEVEEARAAVNRLRYELSFVKAEYEHGKTDYGRQLQELKMQHELELTNLRKERDATLSKVQAESSSDANKVRVLQRDNTALHMRLKGLLAEVDELRAEKEKVTLDSDSAQRTQAKQIGELQATIRSLEVERESLKRQNEAFQNEILTHGADMAKLRANVHELERDLMAVRGQAEEAAHRAQVQLSDLKLDMVRQRGELEKERDKLANLVEDLRTQVEIAEHKVRQLQVALDNKERESVHRVTAAHEEEFVKIAKTENEKFELETKLQEMERRKIDDDARRHAEQEKLVQRMQAALVEREQAEREVAVLKARLEKYDALQDQVERERSENTELRARLHQLEVEQAAAVRQEQDLTDQMIKLRNEGELAREELRLTRQQLNKLQTSQDQLLSQQRVAMQEERSHADSRLSEMEQKLSELQSKYSLAAGIHKKLKKKYSRVTEYLRDKITVLKVSNHELDLEKQVLHKNTVAADQHLRLKKQWRDLYHRHQEFRAIILGYSPRDVIFGNKGLVKGDNPSDFTLPNMTFMEQELEKQHQEDLRMLRKRLDHLDYLQTAQLEELSNIAHSTLLGSQV
ncbi:centrosomal protein of 83 kDa-like isoform X2 [Pomacea canaliculata]|nr:centrosomal protein of 83 kDa-like isoform X2 [Pomacea canaliculata]